MGIDYGKVLENMSLGLSQAINQAKDINIKNSGSTAIFALITKNEIIVANVGDSKCYGLEIGADKTAKIISLATDMTPEIPEEQKRIEEKGGIIRPYKGNFILF